MPLFAPRGWRPERSPPRSSLLPRADGTARRRPPPRSQPARRAPWPALLSPGAACARPPLSWKRSLHWLRPGALANQEAAIMEEGNKYKMAARIKPGIGLRPGDGGIEALTRAPRAARRSRPRCRRCCCGAEPPPLTPPCCRPLPAVAARAPAPSPRRGVAGPGPPSRPGTGEQVREAAPMSGPAAECRRPPP